MRHSPTQGADDPVSPKPAARSRLQILPTARPKRNLPADQKTPSSTAQSMLLQSDPSLAEVPGFTREQLDALARSVELRRQQLQQDINDYIKSKQDELRNYGHQLVDQYRSMQCPQQLSSAQKTCASNAEDTAPSPAPQEPSAPEPEERIKQKKHTKVHKREQELYGLVTPVFLPLLDARDSSPEKRKRPTPKPDIAYGANSAASTPVAGAARDAEQSKEGRKQRKDNKDMENPALGVLTREKQPAEAAKKSKRSTMKKSALRHKDKAKTPRKRVSLVIDGQTVHPSDTVDEPLLTSPSSETTSASNSIASLDDMIDPRLTSETPVYIEHHDAVHHSLPLPMANAIRSANKALTESQTPTPVSIATEHSPPLHSPRSPSIPFGSAQTASRTFLDPSPTQPPHPIPETAGPNPIFPNSAVATTELQGDGLADQDQDFDTYVGGLHGSGVADVDQAGSYGYPSSLGASYMESYMQNRPLRVRMEAASKAGLSEAEKRKLLEERVEEEEDEHVDHHHHHDDDFDDNDDDYDDDDDEEMFERDDVHHARHRGRDNADVDSFMGDMDDF
ncbi:hypothetical protein COCC4DRAFT_50908 [Bipolaris maydis ATCC 48331]|uniref:Uncharacterized protein n=2 Tax=Cochliobolus heterostrophus TaxID=5016 RepID=M2U2N0_COCH5|nr:uncharacterized protein COCC4DRAFT_50908 [Bipolaris maydis ATCC 48331]EMD92774.1 hypothetical protein COCHEDRAFT_1202719 [Bipolaris maydis C5]KAH7558862.1 hypothetical protein BM1_04999 [Bipolaris maydis]ENI04838.1 hypothetical protein COCC4DRAFT_50908 [Bipolaris maydis ATCC 48331]KAJ5026141.1 hypothetical protein J3E73DRAFT_432081 [Bipolaris maydis]KAJ6208367.1 hypothetical protein PSV09DRAFT_1202719 [Bipolaris maydis]